MSTKEETHTSITSFSSSWETWIWLTWQMQKKANKNFFNRKPLCTALLLSGKFILWFFICNILQNAYFGIQTKAQPNCRCCFYMQCIILCFCKLNGSLKFNLTCNYWEYHRKKIVILKNIPSLMHKSILKSWEKVNGWENEQVHNNISIRFYRAETLSYSRQRKHSREKK